MRYDKDEVEIEAKKSVEQNAITEKLGVFILDRANEISLSSFSTEGNEELNQALVDEAVMRCCEKFLHYYREGGSAANLVISMIYSAMYNKMTSLNWSDMYGHKISGKIKVIENGSSVIKYVRYMKDDNKSQKL